MSKVRVRFAPSPTGHLHIGSLRSALFNWLFAKHNSGIFLLRIEDTDLQRSLDIYTDSILKSFEWVGIKSDEPLVYQSKRISQYQMVANQLIDTDNAYRCICTHQELVERLGYNSDQGGYTQYDGLCRDKNYGKDLQKPFVIRFKRPIESVKYIEFIDLIHGNMAFDINQINDFILIRSDGYPMYNFAVVVDDHDMSITHVIRGEEHLGNTPKQILIYNACKYIAPEFAHIPLILAPDGKKLSKRDAATSVLDYRKKGFLPEALCNYLVRLGWSWKDQEIFTKQEMIEYFDLKDVSKKGSIFDIKKLEWLNSVYIKKLSPVEIVTIIKRDVDENFDYKFPNWSLETIYKFISIYKERVKTLSELEHELVEIYTPVKEFNKTDLDSVIKLETKNLILDFINRLSDLKESFSSEKILDLVKQFCNDKNVIMPEIAKPIRLALTGKFNAPSINDLIYCFGYEESIERLNYMVGYIDK